MPIPATGINQIDGVLGALGLLPKTDYDNIGTEIVLTAPAGQEFKAAWQRNPREKSKRLVLYDYPGVNGSLVYDLGLSSEKHDIQLIFGGNHYHTESEAFGEAFRQKGWWTVMHPIYGFKELQPLSIKMTYDVIDSLGVVRVDTVWMDFVKPEDLTEAKQLAQAAKDAALKLDDNAFSQFGKCSKYDTFLKQVRTVNAFKSGMKGLMDTGKKLFTEAPKMLDSWMQHQREFTRAVLDPRPDITAIASVSQSMANLVPFAPVPIIEKNKVLEAFQASTEALLPPFEKLETLSNQSHRELAENFAVMEFLSTSILSVRALSPLKNNSGLLSRAQVVEYSYNLEQHFLNTLDKLEMAKRGLALPSDNAAMGDSFDNAQRMIYSSCAFLFRQTYDLRIERIVTLRKQWSVPALVVAEYGSLGENDANYDDFLANNNLHGLDVLYLREGREVKFYGAKNQA